MPSLKSPLLIALALLLSIAFAPLTHAQQNLLFNPGFEQFGEFGRYAASLGDPDFNFAEGWAGWRSLTPRTESWQNINPLAYPHSGGFKLSGGYSQEIGRSGGTFTAAAYQVVNDIPNGTTLRASVRVYMENGPGTGARARIGIGSNVGGNATAPQIVWSPFNTSVNSWQELTVEATVPAGSVTVFIFATQDTPNGPSGPNSIYMDNASLVVTGAGDPNVPSGDGGAVNVPPVATSTPVPQFAAFVARQGTIENGKIVHTVVAGDTLAAIAVAYGVSLDQLRQLNNIPGSILFVGQKIIIGDAPPPTPTATNTRPAPTATVGALPAFPTQAGALPTRAGSGIVTNPTVVAALNSPTPMPTQPPPTSTPMPTSTPTATTPPPTPTFVNTPLNPNDAPSAPVVQGQTADPLATTASICVLMFNDENQNRVQNVGEGLLADGVITLRRDGVDISAYRTNGVSEPFCFTDLETGSYAVVGTPPPGFGLTTPVSLVVSVQAGTSFRLQFGAAEGLTTAAIPTPDTAGDAAPALNEATTGGTANLESVAGVLVMVGAAFVVVGGTLVFLAARRLG
ncbi:LysM peptidoglycan-binding domain-containing protein [Aggregatilineales bacterium SYSU G02658]